jgi:hypothetical protein
MLREKKKKKKKNKTASALDEDEKRNVMWRLIFGQMREKAFRKRAQGQETKKGQGRLRRESSI